MHQLTKHKIRSAVRDLMRTDPVEEAPTHIAQYMEASLPAQVINKRCINIIQVQNVRAQIINSTVQILEAIESEPDSDIDVSSGINLRSVLDNLERRLIGDALRISGGNRARAAELLGIPRTTLVQKLAL